MSTVGTRNFINQDLIVATFLLMVCGVFINAIGDIELTNYGTITSEVWPSIVLTFLTIFCVIYFISSLNQALKKHKESHISNDGINDRFNYKTFLPKNVVLVFGIFGLFVYSLSYIGILIGGVLFVFFTLSMLGPRTLRALLLHLGIAVISVGLMWIIFTYALNVMLPEGELIYNLLY